MINKRKIFRSFQNRDQFKYVTEDGNSKMNHGTKIIILTKTTRMKNNTLSFEIIITLFFNNTDSFLPFPLI